MRKKTFIPVLILTFIIEAVLCGIFLFRLENIEQDPATVNGCLKSVETNYGNPDLYDTSLDYVVLDESGTVVFRTKKGLSENRSDAIRRNDTILEIELGGEKGHIIFRNSMSDKIRIIKIELSAVVLGCSVLQFALVLGYYLYLRKNVIEPFNRLGDFAVRVAEGNLDLPLDMDRKHIFGGFTEAFDLMRNELKKSRAAERKAVEDKKEMVAKLSHDIKTPVASIKSSSEFGYELSNEPKIKELFNQIDIKADQLTLLTDNLFNSSVADVTEISVSPIPLDSSEIPSMIKGADHLNKTGDFSVPECRVFADKMRLQQVFDNIIMNSYKYADTKINVKSYMKDEYLVISIADEGPGVTDEELPLMKQKYKRGSNSKDKDGAGLGLYLTDTFVKGMDGKLFLDNSEPGLEVLVYLRLI